MFPLAASDTSDVLIAQAFGEYGGISNLASSIQNTFYAAEERIARMDATTWWIVGLVAVALFVFKKRR
jgi:hypothetical protein